MNEELIDMARRAGFAIDVSTDPNSPPSWWAAGHDDRFKAFAALVRADEREACIYEIEMYTPRLGHTSVGEIRSKKMIEAIRARGEAK